MHQQCLLRQMFPIWRKGKNGVSNNNCLHLNTAWRFAVLKALPMYTSAQLIAPTTLGGGWDVYYIIVQQFVAPSFVMLSCASSFHTCSF